MRRGNVTKKEVKMRNQFNLKYNLSNWVRAYKKLKKPISTYLFKELICINVFSGS